MEAQRKVLAEKIQALRLSRMAWADADYVRDEFMMYLEALDELNGVKLQRARAAWEEMKLMGKG
jgi:hypothetical protein